MDQSNDRIFFKCNSTAQTKYQVSQVEQGQRPHLGKSLTGEAGETDFAQHFTRVEY